VPAFNPRHVTGPDAGTRSSPIVKHGSNPVAVVFARELSPGVATLAAKLDAAAKADRRLGAFVVLLTDDKTADDRLKAVAEREKLTAVPLTVLPPPGPKGYDLSADDAMTVVLYARRKVTKTFAFAKGKPADADVAAVMEAVGEMVKATK
jgi:hypothetical protein